MEGGGGAEGGGWRHLPALSQAWRTRKGAPACSWGTAAPPRCRQQLRWQSFAFRESRYEGYLTCTPHTQAFKGSHELPVEVSFRSPHSAVGRTVLTLNHLTYSSLTCTLSLEPREKRTEKGVSKVGGRLLVEKLERVGGTVRVQQYREPSREYLAGGWNRIEEQLASAAWEHTPKPASKRRAVRVGAGSHYT